MSQILMNAMMARMEGVATTVKTLRAHLFAHVTHFTC